MTQKEIKKIIFILFDEKLLDDVVYTFEKYEYLIDCPDIKLAYLISKIYTTEDDDEQIKYLKEIADFKASEIFPDIKILQNSLALECYENNLIEYSKLLNHFKKQDLDFAKNYSGAIYNSPAYTRISINGSDFDDQMNYVNKCKVYIKDKIVFRQNINKITKIGYRDMLKVQHAIEVGDFEYGLEAVRDLQEHFKVEKIASKINKENFREYISEYAIIIEFFNVFQILGKDITTLKEYYTLKKMFHGIILELNVDSLLAIEAGELEALKQITETKKYLIDVIGYDEVEINSYLKEILERIKLNRKRKDAKAK